ncbi:MAG: hypothetical protein QF385_06420, partial [SAR324 cluster bacterium]|nr:hypothetical protein [SAR324 cluster bacterium]
MTFTLTGESTFAKAMSFWIFSLRTKLMYFSAINESRFKKIVIPGDQVIFEVKLLKFRMGTCKISGTAS